MQVIDRKALRLDDTETQNLVVQKTVGVQVPPPAPTNSMVYAAEESRSRTRSDRPVSVVVSVGFTILLSALFCSMAAFAQVTPQEARTFPYPMRADFRFRSPQQGSRHARTDVD